MPGKLTQIERRELLTQFARLLAGGADRTEIVEQLDILDSQYEMLLQGTFIALENEISGKSTIRLYAEYVSRQLQLSRDLEDLKAGLRGARWKNGQAYVGAVKTQSEIMDKIIKTGQELEIIVKRADKVMLIDGRDPREMDRDELASTLKNEIREARALSSRNDRGRKKGKILTIDPSKKEEAS